MGLGLLKRAGAFLLASAMVLNTASTGWAASVDSDMDGPEEATETAAEEAGAPGGTDEADEPTQPTASYIICLPEGDGIEYSYDLAHRSEEDSDATFTILLY